MNSIIYYLKIYIVSLISFLVIDLLWIGVFANSFYRDHIGFLLASTPNWTAAILFYLMFVAGVVYFAVLPGLEKNTKRGIMNAALFGLMTYGTYDLTNLALVQGWPVVVTFVDMVWGMCLSVLICLTGINAGQRFR